MDNIKDFMEYLLEKTISTTKKGDKTIYDVVSSKPQEKEDTSGDENLYSDIKKELLNHIHKQRLYNIKKLMHDYAIPTEVKQKITNDLMVPISELSDEENKSIAKQISAIFSIFKKYIETKQTITKKEVSQEEQSLPLATIKQMINQGKTMKEIGKRFNLPVSSLAFKIKSLYQTTYSDIKKNLGK